MISLLVALATAALVHFGAGLHPVAVVTWVIPLPVLLLAVHRPGSRAWLAGGVGTALGFAGMWDYCRRSLEMPVPLILGYLALPAVVMGVTVAVFALLVRRGRLIAAMFWVPAAWTAAEYAIATLSPAGTFLSLANSQTGVRPVLNLAALTGSWGITFLLMLVPAAVAVLTAPGRPDSDSGPGLPLGSGFATWPRPAFGRVSWWGLVVAAVVPIALGLGYGAWAAARPPAPDSMRVALIARPGPDGYRERIAALDSVRLVVLPETTFTTDDTTRDDVLNTLRRPGMSVVTGLRDTSGAGTRNLAVLVEGSEPPVVYAKQRLIPGVESDFKPGADTVVTTAVDGLAVRLLICKDMDFPDTVRRAGAQDLLVVPAWDFQDDARLHARIAMLRAVENGLPLIRTARDGELLATDRAGRILGETTQPGDHTGTATGNAELIVDVPVDRNTAATPYRNLGDWFAWLCLLTGAVTVTLALRRTRPGQALPAELRSQASAES